MLTLDRNTKFSELLINYTLNVKQATPSLLIIWLFAFQIVWRLYIASMLFVAAGPNTTLHMLTCIVSMGYFIFDFSWCLYYRSEGKWNLCVQVSV